MPRADLITRWVAARREVATHKAAIRRHREQLQAAAAAAAAIEAEARAVGLSLITVPAVGEGDRVHGRTESPSTR